MPSVRQTTFRLGCLIAVLASMSLASSIGKAADRDVVRFRGLLLSRHDNARVAALNSIPRDFQSRQAALPILIEALEQLEDDARFDRLEKKGLPDLPDGVRLMIDFVGTVDRPEATEALVQLLACDRLSWMMATVQTLGKHQHHAAIEPLVALIDSEQFDESYGFRFTLARSLKEMKHPDAWDALAKLFDRVDGQLAHRLNQEFQTVTAEDFRGDEDHFKTWRGLVGIGADQPAAPEDPLAKAAALLAKDKDGEQDMPLPKRMGLQAPKTGASYVREMRLKPSHYYGIDIYAKRLLFVIDRSGSMKHVVYGRTRLERAQGELIAAVNGLDEQVEFGILVFDEQVRAWRDNLVEATDENKRNAIRFVERLSAGSSTNTYAALRRSLDFDPQLEAIFILTDGKPTTGQIVDHPTILMDILRRNEVNNITINAIAVAVEPLMATFLQNLTEPSNGEFKEVR